MFSEITDKSSNYSFSEAEAAQLAMQLYGLRGQACFLPGEYDHNFHFTAEDGTEFVLKVMHADREHTLLDLQCRALAHLAEHSPSLVMPGIRPTRKGEWIASINLSDETGRFVWLLSYVPGV